MYYSSSAAPYIKVMGIDRYFKISILMNLELVKVLPLSITDAR